MQFIHLYNHHNMWDADLKIVLYYIKHISTDFLMIFTCEQPGKNKHTQFSLVTTPGRGGGGGSNFKMLENMNPFNKIFNQLILTMLNYNQVYRGSFPFILYHNDTLCSHGYCSHIFMLHHDTLCSHGYCNHPFILYHNV